jgi:hypothetical protein
MLLRYALFFCSSSSPLFFFFQQQQLSSRAALLYRWQHAAQALKFTCFTRTKVQILTQKRRTCVPRASSSLRPHARVA